MAPVRRGHRVRASGGRGPGPRRPHRRPHPVPARGGHRPAPPGAQQPDLRRPRREPTGPAERGRGLGLHPVGLEGHRRRGSRAGHPHHLLRRRAADRHGDGPRRAPPARQRGRCPAPAAARPPARRRRGGPTLAHPREITSILGISIVVDSVSAKFKYGGNVDEAHRLAVVDHLQARQGPGDAAAAGHVVRRLARPPDAPNSRPD